jgi:NTE family protein
MRMVVRSNNPSLNHRSLRRYAGSQSAQSIPPSSSDADATEQGTDNRTVVFVDREDGVPVPGADDERPIDYVGVRIRPEHVLASCAIPVLFPSVRVRKPSGATGWYLDGGLRLTAPLKPALALDADALVVVATHPMRDTTTTPQPGGVAPDVDDILGVFVDIAFIDRTVEDLRTLDKINALVPEDELVATASGRVRKKVPFDNGYKTRSAP